MPTTITAGQRLMIAAELIGVLAEVTGCEQDTIKLSDGPAQLGIDSLDLIDLGYEMSWQFDCNRETVDAFLTGSLVTLTVASMVDWIADQPQVA